MPHCLCPLKQAAKESPQSLAFIDSKIALSFLELDQQTDKMASQLHTAGIQNGSLIAAQCPLSHKLISLFFAAWRLGACICPINLRLPSSQTNLYLQRLSPQLFISSFPLNFSKGQTFHPSAVSQSLFLFTSGSTATPKIAVLSLASLMANALGAIVKLDLRPNDRWLLSLPLYHVSGIGILLRSILARATVTLNESDPHITHLSWVPTQLYRSTPLYKKLRCLLLGGAAVHSFPKQLPCFVSYGLTEMGSAVTAAYQPSDLFCGHPLQKREVQISPDGEILTQGECLFQGYWKEGKLENQNGWFQTGDLGLYCPQRGLKITGRKDWQFISGGENIQPEEIEAALLQIETVLEAVVVPQKDPEFGFRPLAFIRSSDPSFHLEQMRNSLLDKLPKYKIPIGLILLDEMPRRGLKVDREKLKNSLHKK